MLEKQSKRSAKAVAKYRGLTCQRRHQITLQDDPTFDPFSILPNLDLLNTDKELVFFKSQASTNNQYSQFTPNGSQHSLSTSRSSILGLDLPPSSHSAGSYHIPSDFGRRSSSLAKAAEELDAMGEFRPFGEDEFEPMVGISLDFDADGNLVGIVEPEEPELPPLLGSDIPRSQVIQEPFILGDGRQVFHLTGDENMPMMAEAALPDADAFPSRTAAQQPTALISSTSETTETEKAVAKNKRAPRRKYHTMIDDPDHISKHEFRSWNENYADNMMASRKRRKITSQFQARKNALLFLYDQGLARVGIRPELQDTEHPLAEQFAGVGLKARLQGQLPDQIGEIHQTENRRRKSEEAFSEHDEEQQRNLRRRGDEDMEFGRGDDQGHIVLGDDSAPEIGMEAEHAMDDRHSSSMMPWGRQSSAVPGSSVKAPGSAQKVIPNPSPLLDRGSVIRSIERHSDPAGPAFGSDDFQPLLSQEYESSLSGNVLETQPGFAGLDTASQEFLGYAMDEALKGGLTRGSNENKRWISFDQLADPGVHGKGVAAQAFLHVLSLATKNRIIVDQEGSSNFVPYGAIHIGIGIPGG